MKNYNFKLYDIRPISVNAANCYSKWGVSKSDEYRIFEAEFEIKMARFKEKLEELKEYFDPEKHCIGLEFRFFFPCETKSGRLHKRKGDVSNFVKSTEDALFNMLEIDDAFVTELRAYKLNSDKKKIHINLWVKNYETL